ncbi:MAG: serine/threonine protein kinase [Desulfobacterales bacterium CG07_land_8_20_14_0_80_52_14]|nr:MAG: serine/threonine protein kinase [Desulfobacterales bacterium CG07_land_8_20_14_0_80_52_14]
MATNLPTFESPFESYQAARFIDEGGSGRVYEVKNTTGDVFAIKSLAPDRITVDRLKRFKNEITFCQKSEHPNVIKVLDAGDSTIKDVKCPFYVMKLYPATLRKLIGSLKPEDALRVFAQVLDGIEAAHRLKVWHRDLKPENILCSGNGASAVVADFGIAHFEEEEIYTAVETKAHARMANFRYSAPEQRVRGRKVDYRADLYSLGLILNELFTGDVPQGVDFRMVKHVNSAYSYLDDLILAMIQHDPKNRPDSIETIKKEMIGRKNAFVALQRYDEATKQVVRSSSPPEFEPLSLVSFDYDKGTLSFKLNRNVPSDWVQEFQHPRGGYSAIIGFDPGQFRISGDTISTGIHKKEHLIQNIVNNTKNFVTAANQGYEQHLREEATRRDREEREALEKAVAEAELKKRILTNVKL